MFQLIEYRDWSSNKYTQQDDFTRIEYWITALRSYVYQMKNISKERN